MSRLSPGLRYMLASTLCFSVMGLLVKHAAVRLPSQQIVLARAVFTLVLSYATLRHLGLSPRGKRPGLLILRGLFGTASLSCFYFSLSALPLADATVIQHTSPILTGLFAAAFLGERLTRRIVLATVAGLAGVAIMVRPGTHAPGLDGGAVAIAFVGSIAAATVYVLVRRLRDSDDPHLIVFYFPLVAVPVTLPTALPVWLWPTPLEWLVLVGVGISTQLAQVFMTRGLTLEPAGRATAMNPMQIVFNMVFGAALFAEWPGPTTLIGATIVVGATLAVALGPAASPTPAPPTDGT